MVVRRPFAFARAVGAISLAILLLTSCGPSQREF
jgi:hypothetical protein